MGYPKKYFDGTEKFPVEREMAKIKPVIASDEGSILTFNEASVMDSAAIGNGKFKLGYYEPPMMITKSGIQIGCKTITAAAMAELIRLWAEFNTPMRIIQ